jgi:branched-chain amino acid transport system substrate-binding protein
VIATHLVKMRANGADTLVVFATPQPTIYALIDKTVIGWSPLTLINNVSANRVFELAAGQNGADLNGVISTGYLESPTVQPNLKGMKLAKTIIDATGSQALQQQLALGDANIVYGLASAWTFVDALKHAGKNLTRPGLMKALRSLKETKKNKNPFVYPGMTVQTSKKRGFPMEQLKLIRWSGGKTGDWHPFGKLYTGIH